MRIDLSILGWAGFLVAVVVSACSKSEAAAPERAAVSTAAPRPSAERSDPVVPDVPAPPTMASYPWGPSAAGDRLDRRFSSPPAGFVRVRTPRGSFGELLRALPLQPEGSPVVDFQGRRLYAEGRHPDIAAVVDIDVGTKDLQQCADAIIRLHAEWRYGRGERDIAYNSVSGQRMSYRDYLAGSRARAEGSRLVFAKTAPSKQDSHALFRGWLDDVFAWAGTVSLERDSKKVPSVSEAVPGDFFVVSGRPFGHAVLVLDVARDERGRLALLLGQSYMPAQSFQVLARDGSPWFIVEPGDAFVTTPFWRPFPASALRRF